jgi:putative membrane protein
MSHINRAVSLIALIVFSTFATAQERKEAPPPLGTASFIPPEGNTKLQPLTAENFVTRAAVTNLAEIDLSQMALDKSTNVDIRKFATQIIKDHQAAQAKLKQIAGAQKIALPGSVDEERRKQREQLKELTGADFEKRYVALMQAGHNEAAGLLEAATKSKELDPAFKNYANTTLQTVLSHKAEAEKLHSAH